MANKAEIVIGAENRAEGVLRQIRAQLGGLSSEAALTQRAFSGLGAGLATALSVGTLAAFFKSTVDGIDALNDLADATGASIENLSALEDVGARAGTSFETVSDSVVKFNKVLTDAKQGSVNDSIFKRLGLDAKELQKIDPAEALRRTAVALSGYADNGNKARIVQQLFGKSTKDVAEFLKELGTQTKLTGTVTDKAAADVDLFNKQLFQAQKNATDLARVLAGPIVESVNAAAASFQRSREKGEGFFGFLAQRYKEVSEQQRKIAGFGIDFSADLAASGTQAGGGRGFVNPPNVTPGEDIGVVAENTAKAASEAQKYLDNLIKQGEQYKDLTNFERALSDIQNKRIDGITPKLQREILLAAQRADVVGKNFEVESRLIDFRKREIAEQDTLEKSLTDSRIKGSDDARAAALRFFEETRTPQEKLNAELEEQSRLLALIGPAYEEVAARASGAAFSRFDDQFKKKNKEIDETTKNLISGTQNIFADTIENIGNDGLRDIDKKFSDLFLRLSAQAVAADLTNKLFGEDGKGIEDLGKRITEQLDSIDFSALSEQFNSLLSGLGESLVGLFSGGSGGSGDGLASAFAGLFAGGYETGGFAPANKVALVGERGPELIFTGNRGTTVQPIMQASAQRPVNYSPTFVLPPQGVSRETQKQIASKAYAGALQAFNRNS